MNTRVPRPPKREAPPPLEETPRNLEKVSPLETETLNFKVTADFKRDFKGYAAVRGITMIDLLKEGYRLYKERYGS